MFFALKTFVVLGVEAEGIGAGSIGELKVVLTAEAASSDDIVGLAEGRDLFADVIGWVVSVLACLTGGLVATVSRTMVNCSCCCCSSS